MATKLRILVGALLASGIALAPTPAHAKGAAAAEITGPRLDQPIEFDTLELSANELAQSAGLGAVLWDEAPGVVEARRPRTRLGAKYVVTYDYLVGQDETEEIRQELYPFARAGPVVFTPRRQRLFDEPVGSGWYRAGPELRDVLVAAGVPQPRRG